MRGSPPFPAGWRSRGPGPVLTGSVFAPSTEAGDHQSHGAADRSHQQRGLRGVHVSTDVVARLSPPCGPRPSDRTCDVAAGALFRGAEGSSGPGERGTGLRSRHEELVPLPVSGTPPRPPPTGKAQGEDAGRGCSLRGARCTPRPRAAPGGSGRPRQARPLQPARPARALAPLSEFAS